jgi:hypothetical protein
MTEPSWTGVIVAYVCPMCHKPDRQKFVFEGVSYDDEVLSKAVANMIPCRGCNTPLPKNLTLETDIVGASLEHLRKASRPDRELMFSVLICATNPLLHALPALPAL